MWSLFVKIVQIVMSAILAAFHVKWTEKQWESFMQFIKFGLVGVSNTVIAYIINILVLLSLKKAGLSFDYIIANLVAFILSVLWSFYWNNKYVFKTGAGETRSVAGALLKTYIAYGFTGIILCNVLSWFWIDVLGISKYIAPLINLIASVPINFFVNKLWAFKGANEAKG